MIRFFWLTAVAVLCLTASDAQASTDSLPGSDANLLFSHFSCLVKNSNSVRIQWTCENTGQGDYFIVERGNDEFHFETVTALKIADTVSSFDLMDNSPLNGSFLYRIKFVDKSGQVQYSKSLPVSLSADVDFKFYPNPADKLLIIRTSHNIDVDIRDGLGTVRISKQLQPGLQVINVSALEKGLYVLKIADRESNRVISEQLVKN